VLSTLGLEIPWRDGIGSARFASLLRTMERLSPHELLVTDNFEGSHSSGRAKEIKANLPCFANTTSIEMSLRNVSFKSLKPCEFSRLERLSLSSLCSTVEIGTLVTRCPWLRVLKVVVSTGKMTVHSASLQELDVNWNVGECHGIDIVTPMLEKLHVNARAGGDIGVSISAPVVQDVSWQCWYTRLAVVFGSWCVQSLRVQTMENVMCLHLNADVCIYIYLPLVNLPFGLHHKFYFVQCIISCPNVLQSKLDAELNFAHLMEQLPVTNFSTVEINFEPAWHIYGALVLQLLRIRRICVAAKVLKVILPQLPKVILRHPY
jgi:hypothetical protein